MKLNFCMNWQHRKKFLTQKCVANEKSLEDTALIDLHLHGGSPIWIKFISFLNNFYIQTSVIEEIENLSKK